MSRLTVLILCFVSLANAQPSPYGSWVEADFPFFSSILDARRAGVGEMNLTPRGIVLPLGNDCRVCYDVDLLRVSAIWRGKGVSDKALAPGSYHDPGRKTLGGQMPAPQPDGKFWMGNGIYPGWQSGAKADLTDPRESAPTETEVGRGALAEGQFKALRLCQDGVVLELRVGNADIREFWQASVRGGREVIARHVEVSPADAPLWLVVGAKSNGPSQELDLGVTVSSGAEIVAHDDVWLVKVPPHAETIRFCVSHCDENAAPEIEAKMPNLDPPARRWIGSAETNISRAADDQAYVVDEIGLPQVNRWKRAVRLSDVQFLPDGTGYAVTIHGDVWRIDGLDSADGPVRWSRFASGLHEPMSLAIRDGEIYVFDRNGVWRLTDTDGNGEADAHVMFCNRFAQTADMREFPSTLRPGPEGEFYIAKGGQAATTLGKHNVGVAHFRRWSAGECDRLRAASAEPRCQRAHGIGDLQ